MQCYFATEHKSVCLFNTSAACLLLAIIYGLRRRQKRHYVKIDQWIRLRLHVSNLLAAKNSDSFLVHSKFVCRLSTYHWKLLMCPSEKCYTKESLTLLSYPSLLKLTILRIRTICEIRVSRQSAIIIPIIEVINFHAFPHKWGGKHLAWNPLSLTLSAMINWSVWFLVVPSTTRCDNLPLDTSEISVFDKRSPR